MTTTPSLTMALANSLGLMDNKEPETQAGEEIKRLNERVTELEVQIKSLNVELVSIETVSDGKDITIEELNNMVKSLNETIENKFQVEDIVQRLEKRIALKDQQIGDLKKQLHLRIKEIHLLEEKEISFPLDDPRYNSVLELRKNERVQLLKEETISKDKIIDQLRTELQEKPPIHKVKDKHRISELETIVSTLKIQLDGRQQEIEGLNKTIVELRGEFEEAYRNGMKVHKITSRETEQKLRKAEVALRERKQELVTLSRDHEQLLDTLRRTERALNSARKLAQVERHFLDLLQTVDEKCRNREESKAKLRERLQLVQEELKKTQAKNVVLRTAYKTMSAEERRQGEGEANGREERIQEQVISLRKELEEKVIENNEMQQESKVLKEEIKRSKQIESQLRAELNEKDKELNELKSEKFVSSQKKSPIPKKLELGNLEKEDSGISERPSTARLLKKTPRRKDLDSYDSRKRSKSHVTSLNTGDDANL